MHLGRPGIAQHLNELLGSVAAHDGIVDDHEALARNHARQRVQLQANAQLAHGLGGLDESAAHVAVLHDTVGERNARGLGIAQGRRHAGVGHAEHEVGLHGRLVGQNAAHGAASLVDRLPVKHGVRPGEVHVFEDAGGPRARRHGLLAGHALGGEAHHLAGFHVAHVLGTDDVEAAGFRRHHPAASLGQPTNA